MSTALKVVPPVRAEVTALVQTCQDLATQHQIDRFELAVKSRLEVGIADDMQLRQTDELLREVVRGMDALDEGTAPAISEFFALHKAAIAAVKPWRTRWEEMKNSLGGLILKYSRAKAELARRQQEELNRAAEQERQRKAEEARRAMRDGDVAGARAAMNQAQTIVTPIISQAAPVLDHSSTRKPWQAEITNPEALVCAIAIGFHKEYLMKCRDAVAKALKGEDATELLKEALSYLNAMGNYPNAQIVPLSVIKEWDLGFLRKEAAKRGGLNWPGIRVWQEEKLAVKR